MPGNGRYQFYFAEKPPMVWRLVATLLFANTIAGLGLAFFGREIFSHMSPDLPLCTELSNASRALHAPAIVCAYAHWDITIQFVLLLLGGIVMVVYRKRVTFVDTYKR